MRRVTFEIARDLDAMHRCAMHAPYLQTVRASAVPQSQKMRQCSDRQFLAGGDGMPAVSEAVAVQLPPECHSCCNLVQPEHPGEADQYCQSHSGRFRIRIAAELGRALRTGCKDRTAKVRPGMGWARAETPALDGPF